MAVIEIVDFVDLAKQLLAGEDPEYIHFKQIAEAEKKLNSATQEAREQAIQTLLKLYDELKPSNATYRLCEINTIFCEHGELRAKEELKKAGIDWKEHGLRAIAKVLEAGCWDDVNVDNFVGFNNLLNRAAEALPWTREGIFKRVKAFHEKRLRKEEGTMVTGGGSDDEYDEDDMEDMKEPHPQTVRQMTLTLGVPKLIKVGHNNSVEEVDLDVASGGNVSKNIIIVMLADDDLQVYTYLQNRYIVRYKPMDDKRFEELEEAEKIAEKDRGQDSGQGGEQIGEQDAKEDVEEDAEAEGEPKGAFFGHLTHRLKRKRT